MAMTNRQRYIRYPEGQWFAVPLNNGGFGIGVLVRGSSRTRGGLGYFLGPKLNQVPGDTEVHNFIPNDAVLVEWFGGLGIADGTWPLIQSTRAFCREEWPVPNFRRIDLLNPEWGWLVEYSQDDTGTHSPIRETRMRARDLVGYPDDGISGSGAIESLLTRLLE
jgi:hypothetical protein